MSICESLTHMPQQFSFAEHLSIDTSEDVESDTICMEPMYMVNTTQMSTNTIQDVGSDNIWMKLMLIVNTTEMFHNTGNPKPKTFPNKDSIHEFLLPHAPQFKNTNIARKVNVSQATLVDSHLINPLKRLWTKHCAHGGVAWEGIIHSATQSKFSGIVIKDNTKKLGQMQMISNNKEKEISLDKANSS